MNLKYRIFAQLESSTDISHLITTNGAPLKAITEALAPLSKAPEVDPYARFKKLARRPGRPIRVVALQEARGYLQPAYLPKVGEEFESLTDFAETIGTSVGNASVQLSAARSSGRSTAVVRGVEYGYVDELARSLNAPPAHSGDLVTRPVVVERDLSRVEARVAASLTAPPPEPERTPAVATMTPPEPDAPKPRRLLVRAGPRPENQRPPPRPGPDESELPEPPTGGDQ